MINNFLNILETASITGICLCESKLLIFKLILFFLEYISHLLQGISQSYLCFFSGRACVRMSFAFSSFRSTKRNQRGKLQRGPSAQVKCFGSSCPLARCTAPSIFLPPLLHGAAFVCICDKNSVLWSFLSAFRQELASFSVFSSLVSSVSSRLFSQFCIVCCIWSFLWASVRLYRRSRKKPICPFFFFFFSTC